MQPNPKRIVAGRLNRALRGPLTPEGRQRLRDAALAAKPWLHSTGPKTPAGKRQSAINGTIRQLGPTSVRAAKSQAAAVTALIAQMRKIRESAAQ